MCGVVAALSLQAPASATKLAATCAAGVRALAHRGPDGQGVLVADGVALGHARLALVDRAGGAQPLRDDDGLALVMNGEVYDHQARRAALSAAGRRFRTQSDSEVALHAYATEGLAGIAGLAGEFALVLWDGPRRRLVAARDRFGVKPLCYAEQDGILLIASEAKALLAMGVPAAWEPAALAQALRLQYLLPEQTLFRGIRQVPPGHALVVEDGRARLWRHFGLDYQPDEERAPQDDDALGEALLAALRRAVRRRLQTDPDVPIGALLSGGLDSSVVAGLLAHEGRRTLFTVRFPGGGDYDEIRVAARSAAALEAELHEVAATSQALWEALPAAVAAGEGVAINLHVAAKYLLCRAVRAAGVPVLLTGEGADELWAGYAHLRRDFLLAGGETDEARLADRAGTGVTAGVHLPPAGADDSVLAPLRAALGVVPTFLQAKAALGRRVHGLLRDDVAAALGGHDPGAALLRAVPLEHLRGRHPVDQAAHLWTALALSGSILRTLGDAQEMAHGIEGRLPFLDDEVVALARQAKVAARLRGGIEKSLLRRAALAAGLVTPEVAARPKHPFMAPPLQDAELAQDLLRAGSLPLFDGARVRALLDELPRLPPGERAGADAALMLALTAVLLGRRYGLGDAP